MRAAGCGGGGNMVMMMVVVVVVVVEVRRSTKSKYTSVLGYKVSAALSVVGHLDINCLCICTMYAPFKAQDMQLSDGLHTAFLCRLPTCLHPQRQSAPSRRVCFGGVNQCLGQYHSTGLLDTCTCTHFVHSHGLCAAAAFPPAALPVPTQSSDGTVRKSPPRAAGPTCDTPLFCWPPVPGLIPSIS